MIFCSSRLATTIWLTILTWICLCEFAFAANDRPNPPPQIPGNDTHSGLICTPFGVCEKCPEDALKQPFCQPFGNRRLMHCVNATSALPPSYHPPPDDGQPPRSSGDKLGPVTAPQHPEGETLAWESCGRIIGKERADFFEFIGCNIFFAIIALIVLFARSKRLHAMQARQLAARIGIIRGTGGGER